MLGSRLDYCPEYLHIMWSLHLWKHEVSTSKCCRIEEVDRGKTGRLLVAKSLDPETSTKSLHHVLLAKTVREPTHPDFRRGEVDIDPASQWRNVMDFMDMVNLPLRLCFYIQTMNILRTNFILHFPTILDRFEQFCIQWDVCGSTWVWVLSNWGWHWNNILLQRTEGKEKFIWN